MQEYLEGELKLKQAREKTKQQRVEMDQAREKHLLEVEMKEKQLELQKQQDEMEIAKAERFLQIQKEMKKHGISSISSSQVSYHSMCFLLCCHNSMMYRKHHKIPCLCNFASAGLHRTTDSSTYSNKRWQVGRRHREEEGSRSSCC
jgi:hypothetical protein